MSRNNSKAIILAGGLGTRLRPVLDNIPKPMAPVRNKPFLEYVLNWLSHYKISGIVLSVGYLSGVIEAYFGNKFNGIPVEYVHESEPLGTGGAIMNALERINGDEFLVINGDTYFPVDVVRLISGHKSMSGDITIALKEMNVTSRYGLVNIDDNRNITGFIEKNSAEKGLINGGVYVINTRFLKRFELPSRFSFERDLLEKEAGKIDLMGMIFEDEFIDIGVPEDYHKAQIIL